MQVLCSAGATEWLAGNCTTLGQLDGPLAWKSSSTAHSRAGESIRVSTSKEKQDGSDQLRSCQAANTSTLAHGNGPKCDAMQHNAVHSLRASESRSAS